MQPERATGGERDRPRLYHAAGYYTPCDHGRLLRPALLTLKPGLTVTDNSG